MGGSGFVLILVGGLVAGIGGILLLMAAFRRSLPWGMAVLLIPFGGLVFLIRNWRESKAAFQTQALGALLAAGGAVLALGERNDRGGEFEPATHAVTYSTLPEFETGTPKSAARENEQAPVAAERETSAAQAAANYIGMPLADVKKHLGSPLGRIVKDGKTILFYGHLELTSVDGVTVSAQRGASE